MLNEIFNSITPENIKDIPLIKDAMDIFIAELEEKGNISKDIRNVFDGTNTIIRNELIKIYLDDMVRYFNKAKNSKLISDKIDEVNTLYNREVINRNFIGDLTDLFNDEHFVTSKAFKQKKGTKVGIEYIYNLVETLSTGSSGSFNFIPGEPFNFNVEGNVLKEIYEEIVKPLSHPLGFTYIYTQIVKLILEDIYQISYTYNNVTVEVRCLAGLIDPYPGNEVTDITFETIDNTIYTRVYFKDSLDVVTYLQQTQLGTAISAAYYEEDGTLIQSYTGHCSVYLEYDLITNILTQDEILFTDIGYIDETYFIAGTQDYVIGDLLVIGEFFIGRSDAPYVMKEEFSITLI